MGTLGASKQEKNSTRKKVIGTAQCYKANEMDNLPNVSLTASVGHKNSGTFQSSD